MLRDTIHMYRARQKLLSRNPSLWMGRSVAVSNSRFEGHNRLGDHSYITNSQLGSYTYIGPRCILNHAIVGRYNAIAPDVMIGTGGHPIGDNASLHPLFYLSRPDVGWDFRDDDQHEEFATTHVGHDVWIGAKVVIRDGVTIGNGAIVGAGAIVVHDLEPFGIYVGTPARLLRFRYPQDVIDRLQAAAWWNRSTEWLRENVSAFSNVDTLLTVMGE